MTADQRLNAPLFHASAVKIKRARHHWNDLERIAREHIASEPVKHTMLDDPGPELDLGFRMDFRGAPEEFGAVVGDVMHNLRASLDLLACDLARANGKSPKGVYFPFCGGPKDLDEMIKHRHFARAGDAAVALLKSMMPYKGGNDALRAIHDLDIQDKHVELIPTGMTWFSPVIRIDGKTKTVSVVPETIGKPNVKLCFPVGSALAGKEIVPTLHELIELAAGVIEAFKALHELPAVNVDAAGGKPDAA